MLQKEEARDYVIGTGETHSVREFLDSAFSYVGLDYEDYVKIDPRYYRPLDVESLVCDIEETEDSLNWKPKISFDELVKIMVDADIKEIGLEPPGEGIHILEEKYPDKWWGVP